MQSSFICQGREVDGKQVEWLARWIGERRHWSRRRLAGELCALWDWRDGRGRAKDLAARSFLLKLESRGLIELPPLREACRKARPGIALPDPEPELARIEGRLAEVAPVSLEAVAAGTEAFRRWAFHLSRHHYLGLRMVGENMAYLARDRFGREVAALLFGAPAWRCAARDAALGWSEAQRREGLARVANNTRFLILPQVRVPHLASHVLGAAARRVGHDWEAKYGHGLDWLETFVERGRFAGTCYRAANWMHVGATRGRGRQDRHHAGAVPPKEVFLYELRR
jgi:hypothetical protein